MYRKKANIAFINKQKKNVQQKKDFSIYTYHELKNISKANSISLIWSQKLKDSEA